MVRPKRAPKRGSATFAPSDTGNLTGYVDVVRQTLRTINPDQFDVWQDAYQTGLQEAYRRKDLDGLVSIAVFGAACLDAQGHHERALDQLDFAMSMSRRDPDAAGYLLSMRAVHEALCGYFDRAQESVAEASSYAGKAKTARGRLGFEAYSASVACIILSDRSESELSECIPLAEHEGLDWLSSALRCWFIPYLFARGKRRTAMPWTQTLRVQAETANHPARLVDAGVFEHARQSTHHPTPDEALVEPAKKTLNVIALWRLSALNLHAGVRLNEASLVDRSLRTLTATASEIHPLFADGVEAFAALVEAYRTGGFEWLPTPQRVGLVNLPCVFAGMEAVAIAGSQENAAEWKAWSDTEIPPLVETALDWPVSLARLRGLLHVRAGAMQSGVRFLRDAIRWAEDHEYALEAALARLQLGEVLSHGGVRATRMGEARTMRKAGWSKLPELGVSPAPQAYAATRAVSLNRDDLSMPRLTAREVDVLSLLADGASYKEIGERLQISWRTAQLHANRIYSKLGVHGKIQAVVVARDLNIL